MKALALTVWDKKIFKVFSFGCHGNQSSSQNCNLWSFLKVHHQRIISVKFQWNLLAGFREEDLSNCSRTDAGHWSITIAHPEHLVLRWAKNKCISKTRFFSGRFVSIWYFAISLILLKMFTLNSEYVFTIQRAIHTIKGDNSKCIFFRIMHLFRLWHFILYQAPYSQGLAPICGGGLFSFFHNVS